MNTTALLVLLFLGFVMVGLTLVLWLGYQSVEEQRQAEAARRTTGSIGHGGFLAPLAASSTMTLHRASGADLLRRLERHVRSENRLAAAFGSCPTLDRLHGPPTPVIEGVIEDLEAYLHQENAAVAGFATGPSISGLLAAEQAVGVNRVFPTSATPERRPL